MNISREVSCDMHGVGNGNIEAWTVWDPERSGSRDRGHEGEQRSMAKPSFAPPLLDMEGPSRPTTVGFEHARHLACSPCANLHIVHCHVSRGTLIIL